MGKEIWRLSVTEFYRSPAGSLFVRNPGNTWFMFYSGPKSSFVDLVSFKETKEDAIYWETIDRITKNDFLEIILDHFEDYLGKHTIIKHYINLFSI